MPQFYFHLYNDIVALDEEGVDLPDLQAARDRAHASAVEMVCHSVRQGHLNLNHRIDVADESGAVVLTMPFREVFTITG
jgi:hypothetical protein